MKRIISGILSGAIIIGALALVWNQYSRAVAAQKASADQSYGGAEVPTDSSAAVAPQAQAPAAAPVGHLPIPALSSVAPNLPERHPERISDSERAEWEAQLPTLAEARREVKKDPHGTPNSIKKMAPIFAELLSEGKKSIEGAQKSFSKFEVCAEDENKQRPASLRVTCYLNAKQLSRVHPDQLTSRLDQLTSKMDAQTLAIVRSYERL